MAKAITKIAYKDLSTSLKGLVWFGWFYVASLAVAFAIGFIDALITTGY